MLGEPHFDFLKRLYAECSIWILVLGLVTVQQTPIDTYFKNIPLRSVILLTDLLSVSWCRHGKEKITPSRSRCGVLG